MRPDTRAKRTALMCGAVIGAFIGLWEGLDCGFEPALVLLCVAVHATFWGLVGWALGRRAPAKSGGSKPVDDGPGSC